MTALRKHEAEPAQRDRGDEVIDLLEIVEHLPKQDADHNFIDAQVNRALSLMQFCLANSPTPTELQKLAASVAMSSVIPEKRRMVLEWLLTHVSTGELSVAAGAITIQSVMDAAKQDAIERALRDAADQLDVPLDHIAAAIRERRRRRT